MIIVFAKAPVPGEVKTRLIPALGALRAARLHTQLTRQALGTARAAGCGPVELHLTRRHSLFKAAILQRGGDLGERMHRALSRAGKPAILIGADCPMLTPGDLRRAMRWLRGGCDVVLAPAADGGYALIGLRRARREVFRGVDWGSSTVFGKTRSNLAGLRWRALRTVWDVDRPEDLPKLRWLRLSSAARRGARR